MKWAAAFLLAGGGFVLVAGLVTALWTGSVAGFLEGSAESQDPAAIEALQIVRTVFLLVGLFVGGLLLAAGTGIFYRQPWARGLGLAGSALMLLLVPVGTVLGIAALVMLGNKRSEAWFT